jgi:two-component system NtrC family sensor kinase
VRTFLAMARSRPAVRAPVQLNDLVRGAVELLHYNLRSTGIALELELAPELPEVVADADQLGQVLLNLIVNAQQALAQAEPPRRLHIGSGRDARGVWLRVADNGPGVPAQERERIFDAFVTTKAEGVGTGLGLAVSRAVVAEHGGALQLEGRSPFGRGASFRLELPVHGGGAPGSEPTLALAALSAPAAAQASEPAAARVLVVDDEPELVTMMRDALESAGYEVASAESGALALALLDAGRFDAVVSDLRMPGVDGHALWRAIGERDPQLARRCVFVTGDMLSPMAADFRHQSGAEVLEKPFAAAELVQRVQHCLALAPAG